MLLLPGPRAPERNSISSSPRQSKTRYPTVLLAGPDAVQLPLRAVAGLGTLFFNPHQTPKGCFPSRITGAVPSQAHWALSTVSMARPRVTVKR